MFLQDPPPTQADLHFRLLGIPVRIHPFFWLVGLFFGISGEKADPTVVFLWVAAVFVSILIHEMGHAIVIRRYGGRPRVVLYAMGGLAMDDRADRTASEQIAISFAGPAAGFLLAALLLVGLFMTGHYVGFSPDVATMALPFSLLVTKIYVEFPDISVQGQKLLFHLLFINIWWGLINLLPIYPLDGGRISRELFLLQDTYRGIPRSLMLSVVAAGGVVLYALTLQSMFMVLFFGYLAYSSYRAWQAVTGSMPDQRGW